MPISDGFGAVYGKMTPKPGPRPSNITISSPVPGGVVTAGEPRKGTEGDAWFHCSFAKSGY